MDLRSFTSGEFSLRLRVYLVSVELESWYRRIDSCSDIASLTDQSSCIITDIGDDLDIDRAHLGDPIDRPGSWDIDPLGRAEHDTIECDKPCLWLHCLLCWELIVDRDHPSRIAGRVGINCLESKFHRVGHWDLEFFEIEGIFAQ